MVRVRYDSPLLGHPFVCVSFETLVYSLCSVSCLTLWVAWLSISCQAESNWRLSSSRSLSSARAMVSFAARRISIARWNSCVALWASTWACRRQIKPRAGVWTCPSLQTKPLSPCVCGWNFLYPCIPHTYHPTYLTSWIPVQKISPVYVL